jgi:hypothetical protein
MTSRTVVPVAVDTGLKTVVLAGRLGTSDRRTARVVRPLRRDVLGPRIMAVDPVVRRDAVGRRIAARRRLPLSMLGRRIAVVDREARRDGLVLRATVRRPRHMLVPKIAVGLLKQDALALAGLVRQRIRVCRTGLVRVVRR